MCVIMIGGLVSPPEHGQPVAPPHRGGRRPGPAEPRSGEARQRRLPAALHEDDGRPHQPAHLQESRRAAQGVSITVPRGEGWAGTDARQAERLPSKGVVCLGIDL